MEAEDCLVAERGGRVQVEKRDENVMGKLEWKGFCRLTSGPHAL